MTLSSWTGLARHLVQAETFVGGGRVAVRSGLAAGEQVVSAGHNKLRNGQTVVVDAQPAPAQRR